VPGNSKRWWWADCRSSIGHQFGGFLKWG
jgi:hypothetical protein